MLALFSVEVEVRVVSSSCRLQVAKVSRNDWDIKDHVTINTYRTLCASNWLSRSPPIHEMVSVGAICAIVAVLLAPWCRENFVATEVAWSPKIEVVWKIIKLFNLVTFGGSMFIFRAVKSIHLLKWPSIFLNLTLEHTNFQYALRKKI